MRGLALLLSLLALLLAPSPAAAQHMRVELVAETAAVAAGGATTLAIVMRPERGWHGYWLNPGEAGAAPRHAWQLPSGWQAGPLRFPVPERMVLIGLVNHVYRGEHALLAELRAPPGAAPGARVPVRLRVDYLVCSDEICVPERAELDLVLGVGPAGARDPAFDRYRAALPRPLAAPGRFASAGGRLRFAIPLPQGTELDRPHLFVAQEDAVAYSAHQAFSRSGDWLVVEIAAGRRAAALDRLNAVLRTGEGIGFALALQPGPVPPAGIPLAPARAPLSAASFLLALLGALAGGLVLNLMPCVFPILSLKALSLARAGESDTQSRSEAIAYTAGALLCCLALGALLLVLRAGGAALGWAFQLQDPRVILLLLLLVTAIALNLAGLYRLPMLTGGDALAGREGQSGAFFTGALAAFVATPCTGPFLGFALGAALVLPGFFALAVFAGLGLGLALPFLLLGFVPALRRRLPRPGAWMRTFQRILAVPMLLTALGLFWVLARQSDVAGSTLGLASALALVLGLWWLGRRQQQGGTLLPLLAVALAVLVPLPFVRAAPATPAPVAATGAEPFSEARLAELRAAGTPVFLYFTADWCLTCKVNERAAIAQAEVQAAFRARGIHVLAGDWTGGDPAIGRFLEGHGRSGVPLYLYYPRGQGEPEIQPQILTVGRLTGLGT